MIDGDLQVKLSNHRIKVNEGKWYDVDPKMRYGTIEVTQQRIYMWRGYVKYEYLWQSNTYVPASTLDRFLALFHFDFL